MKRLSFMVSMAMLISCVASCDSGSDAVSYGVGTLSLGLSANPSFHVVLPKTAVPGADITPLGTLFLPHRTGTDGFFAAILERN